MKTADAAARRPYLPKNLELEAELPVFEKLTSIGEKARRYPT
jgi:hypothetical protein